jgi:hypothetical protein
VAPVDCLGVGVKFTSLENKIAGDAPASNSASKLSIFSHFKQAISFLMRFARVLLEIQMQIVFNVFRPDSHVCLKEVERFESFDAMPAWTSDSRSTGQLSISSI